MSDHRVPVSPRDPHVVYSLPSSADTLMTQQQLNFRTDPHKPKISAMYLQSFLKHLKNEYWAYIALAGLTCLYTGIMVAVFGFSNILDPNSGAIEWFGVFLILVGIGLVLASMILYHRKVRRLRPCICCGMDEDAFEPPVRNKKRLRFAPNLISPYYEVAREREKTMMLEKSPVIVEERTEKRDSRSEVLTTPVQVIGDSDMMDSEEQVAYASEGSTAALITTEHNGTRVTMC